MRLLFKGIPGSEDKEVPLNIPGGTLGRDGGPGKPRPHILIPHHATTANWSREHASFEWDGFAWYITLLTSKDTILDGQPLRHRQRRKLESDRVHVLSHDGIIIHFQQEPAMDPFRTGVAARDPYATGSINQNTEPVPLSATPIPHGGTTVSISAYEPRPLDIHGGTTLAVPPTAPSGAKTDPPHNKAVGSSNHPDRTETSAALPAACQYSWRDRHRSPQADRCRTGERSRSRKGGWPRTRKGGGGAALCWQSGRGSKGSPANGGHGPGEAEHDRSLAGSTGGTQRGRQGQQGR